MGGFANEMRINGYMDMRDGENDRNMNLAYSQQALSRLLCNDLVKQGFVS